MKLRQNTEGTKVVFVYPCISIGYKKNTTFDTFDTCFGGIPFKNIVLVDLKTLKSECSHLLILPKVPISIKRGEIYG